MRNGEITAFFCLSQQTAWAPAVTEVFSASRWPVLPTSDPGDQKFELLYIPLSLTVLHRAEKEKANHKTLAQSPDVGSS